MEEIYTKPDDRKPWQKNVLLAGFVLIMFFVGDAILSIPWKIKLFVRTIFKKSGNKRAKAQPGPETRDEHIIAHSTQNFQPSGRSLVRV
jgi:hypothetical protein